MDDTFDSIHTTQIIDLLLNQAGEKIPQNLDDRKSMAIAETGSNGG